MNRLIYIIIFSFITFAQVFQMAKIILLILMVLMTQIHIQEVEIPGQI